MRLGQPTVPQTLGARGIVCCPFCEAGVAGSVRRATGRTSIGPYLPDQRYRAGLAWNLSLVTREGTPNLKPIHRFQALLKSSIYKQNSSPRSWHT